MRIRDALVLVSVLAGGAAACSREVAAPGGDGPRTTLTGQGGDSTHTGTPGGTPTPPPPPPPDTLGPGNPPYTGLARIYGRVTGATFIQSAPAGSDTVRMVFLAGVVVRAERAQGGTVAAETTTNATGDFTLPDVSAGAYTIHAIAPAGSGYRDATRPIDANSPQVRADLTLWRNQ